MSAVLAAKVTNRIEPSPNAACAAIATTEAPPGTVGRMSYWTAKTVRPMNRTPSRIDIAVIVLAAFLASGGLNAGTPLAIASTPVSATEPPAKALSRSRMPSVSAGSGNGIVSGPGGTGTTVPPMMLTRPMATIERARPTNR